MTVGKPFDKGKSGNPGGRPKGLERRVRELLGDDIDAMTLAMRDIVLGQPRVDDATGEPVLGPDGKPVRVPVTELAGAKVSTRDRIEAYKALADRGWGKPRQTVDVSGDLNVGERLDLDDLPEATLRALADLDASVSGNATEH